MAVISDKENSNRIWHELVKGKSTPGIYNGFQIQSTDLKDKKKRFAQARFGAKILKGVLSFLVFMVDLMWTHFIQLCQLISH